MTLTKTILILITLVFLISCSHVNNDIKLETQMVSKLSQEDIQIIKNLRLLEDLETLESMEDENIELLENLDYIENMENEEESNLQEKKNG